MPAKKETHFFDKRRAIGGINAYISNWGVKDVDDAAHGNAKLVDITPRYMLNRFVPERIRMTLPHNASGIRMVALLRDPLRRSISNWKQWRDRTRHWTNRGEAELLHGTVRSEIFYLKRCYTKGMSITPSSAERSICHTAATQSSMFVHCLNQTWQSALSHELLHPRSVFANDIDGLENIEPSAVDGGPPSNKGGSVVLRSLYADQLRNYLCNGFNASNILLLASEHWMQNPEEKTRDVLSFWNLEPGLLPSKKFNEADTVFNCAWSKFRGMIGLGNRSIFRASKSGSFKPKLETQRILANFLRAHTHDLHHLLRTTPFGGRQDNEALLMFWRSQ